MTKKIIKVSLGLFLVNAIVGCDTNGNYSDSSASNAYNVTAIDGYLNGAEVWLDLNENFVLDENEPNATSGAGGVATLDVTGIDNPSLYPVIVRAIPGVTVDETEGEITDPFVMSAPAGEQAVTPLTTVVHNTMEKDPTLTKSEAVQQLASALGLEPQDVLGDFISGDSKPKAAYAAEQIVSLGALPSSPEDLAKAADTTSTESSKFKVIVAAVNQDIKEILNTIPDNQTTEQIKKDLLAVPPPAPATSDTDGDGVPDAFDAFAQDPTEWSDNDNDNLGDNEDDPYPNDSDNDGHDNNVDKFPNDETEWKDDDNDGLGDNLDDPYPNDSDNDSYDNDTDRFPNDNTEWKDDDNDGLGDNEDDTYLNDTDNDGYNNDIDRFPNDKTEWQDDDNDGLGDNEDDKSLNDTDNDGIANNDDNCLSTANPNQVDSDLDGLGDLCDYDINLTWSTTNWNDATWQ